MKLISHRGNVSGPNPSRENTPSYIDTGISAGYDVEVDIRCINGTFYLGHDTPDFEISKIWMEKRKDKLWFHCKNIEAATRLTEIHLINGGYNFFCHTTDSFVMTNNGYIWVHDLTMGLSNITIIPLLDNVDLVKYYNDIVYGICTDYITLAEFKLRK